MAQIPAPYDIQSIYSKHPHLPQQLVHTLRLDASLAHNAPLTPKLIKEAQVTAVVLERIQEFHASITDAVIQTAKGRAALISQAYSSAEFNVPAPPAAALMDAIIAIQASVRNIQESQRRMEEGQRRMLVPGDGTALANTLAPNDIAHVAALPQPPVVGTAYAPTIEPHNLTHQAILDLIRFYNEDFDIVLGDSIAARSQKVFQWLTFGL